MADISEMALPDYKYEGSFNELNQRHGPGAAAFKNGDSYTGDYVNGKRHGHGIYTFANGSTYVGEWSRGKKNGQGTFVYPDGTNYTGSWHDDERSGYGIYKYSNKDTYEGEWKNHLRHGHGTYIYFATGIRYTGEWATGHRFGEGKTIAIEDDEARKLKFAVTHLATDDKMIDQATHLGHDEIVGESTYGYGTGNVEDSLAGPEDKTVGLTEGGMQAAAEGETTDDGTTIQVAEGENTVDGETKAAGGETGATTEGEAEAIAEGENLKVEGVEEEAAAEAVEKEAAASDVNPVKVQDGSSEEEIAVKAELPADDEAVAEEER